MPYLSWLESGQLRRQFLEADCQLGRDPQFCSVSQPADESVSRRHAVLFMQEGRWRVRDLGSRNGTLLNGRRVPEGGSMLGDGDELSLGGLEAQLHGDLSGSGRRQLHRAGRRHLQRGQAGPDPGPDLDPGAGAALPVHRGPPPDGHLQRRDPGHPQRGPEAAGRRPGRRGHDPLGRLLAVHSGHRGHRGEDRNVPVRHGLCLQAPDGRAVQRPHVRSPVRRGQPGRPPPRGAPVRAHGTRRRGAGHALPGPRPRREALHAVRPGAVPGLRPPGNPRPPAHPALPARHRPGRAPGRAPEAQDHQRAAHQPDRRDLRRDGVVPPVAAELCGTGPRRDGRGGPA